MRDSSPTPRLLLALAVAAAAFLALPLAGLIAGAPWSRIGSILDTPVVREAMVLSMVSSLAAALISLVLGVPLAYVLARHPFPGLRLVRGLVLLPLVLPPVVGGTALLLALGRRGLVGEPLQRVTGLVLPFTPIGVVVAATFVALPFMVITMEGAFRSFDRRYEMAASTLGAGRWTVLRRVTLPLVAPSVAAGMLLTWARALGEFGATITFAGNLQGRTQTLPLAVYVALESDRDLAVAISLVMVAVSLLVLVALRDRWWRSW